MINRILFCVAAFMLMLVAAFAQAGSLGEITGGAEKSIGKSYALVLRQINLEVSDGVPYIRAFDKDYNTIFIYFNQGLANKVANLEVNNYYKYSFKVTKNDKYSTLSGQLSGVAMEDGKAVSAKADPKKALSVRVMGKAAEGKIFEVIIAYKGKMKGDDGVEYLSFNCKDPYDYNVKCTYPESLAEAVSGLNENGDYKVKMKVLENSSSIKGELQSIGMAH